ncbi:hypothetical protein HKD37_06G014559 [Glycine soja]
MGYYCYKRKAYSTHTSDVIVMLAVALMLLGIPWLFTREQVVVVEEKKTNWSALITPILVLLILLLLSLIGTPRRVYAKPMCYRCNITLAQNNYNVSSFEWKQTNSSEMKMGYGRSRASSVLDGFTLNPVPYPVMPILSLILLFLGISGWMLLATPVVLILVVRWLSSVYTSEWFFFNSLPLERRRRTHHFPSEGSSPRGVAACSRASSFSVHFS